MLRSTGDEASRAWWLRFFAPLTLRSRMTSWLSRSEGLISPSLSAKERGFWGELRVLINRNGRKVRNVLFIFSLRPWRPSRFLGKKRQNEF